MTSQLQPVLKPEITYPESDGRPMSDNTKQFRWIVVIQQNLEWLFAAAGDVFVAGDLLWYPVEGDNKTCQAPDVMVVFGMRSPVRRAISTLVSCRPFRQTLSD